MKVKMVSTLAPAEIPNGSVGEIIGTDSRDNPILYAVKFGTYVAYVYRREIEFLGGAII